jgi:hypothetical protein
MFYTKYNNNENATIKLPSSKNYLEFNNNNEKIESYKNQDYETLKRECLSQRKLFEDPLFPATFPHSKSIPAGVKWKRPSEIIRWPFTPFFIHNESQAFDLDEGILGKTKLKLPSY